MAENTAFSSSGEEVISRAIEMHKDGPQDLPYQELLEYCDIDRTAREITEGDFKRVSK